MPSLYGNTSTSYTVTASNVSTLYMASTNTVFTATTYSTNLAGLYGGSYAALPTNAQQLIQLFDNSGNVNFYLNPLTSSATIFANFIGTATLTVGNFEFNGNTLSNVLNQNVCIETNGNEWCFNPDGSTSFPYYTFPSNDGTSGQLLTTDGSGTLAWTTNTGGVTSILAGSGISVSTSSGAVTVSNTGVTSITAGTGTFVSTASGNVTIWSAGSTFDISTVTNQKLFTTSSVTFGNLQVTNLTTITGQSTLSRAVLTINSSGGTTYEPPHADGYGLWVIGEPSTSARIVTDAYAGSSADIGSVWTGRKARGTASAPSAVQNGDLILRVAGMGYGTTEFGTTSTGYFEVLATENFTDGSRGSRINFGTTNQGSNDISTPLTLQSSGSIITAPTSAPTQSALLINQSESNSYIAPGIDGYLVWGINKPNTRGRFAIDTYINEDVDHNNASIFTGRRARGTVTAPTAVQTDDTLVRLNGFGFNGTNFSTSSTGFIHIVANETHSSTAHGGRIEFGVMNRGSTTTFSTAVLDDTKFTTENVVATANVTGVNFTATNNIRGATLSLTGISSVTTTNVLYYNASTDVVSYGPSPAAGNPFNQSLNTTNSPTFAGLTLNGALTGGTWTYAGTTIELDTNGAVLTADPDATHAGFLVNESGTTSYQPPHFSGYNIWTINKPSTSARIVADTYGTNLVSSFAGRRALGTASSPTAVTSGLVLARYSGMGYGTTEFGSTSSGFLNIVSTENFTDTAHGTEFSFFAAPNGSTTNNRIFTINNSGSVLNALTASATDAALQINPSGLTTYEAPGADGYAVWAINKTGQAARFVGDTYDAGDSTFFTGRRARGTADAPSAVQNGDVLNRINGFGFGATQFNAQSSGAINFVANENHTGSANGGRIEMSVTANGSTTNATRLTLTATELTASVDIIPGGFHNIGSVAYPWANSYIGNLNGVSNLTFSDATTQTTAWTGAVSTSSVTGLATIAWTGELSDGTGQISTSTVSGLSIVGYTNDYNDLTNLPVIPSPFDLSTVTNQALFTTSTVAFGDTTLQSLTVTTGTQLTKTLSVGGFPLNSAGTSSWSVLSVVSPTLIVSNTTPGQNANMHIRGFGQNNPNGGSATNPNVSIRMETAFGTNSAPTRVTSGQNLGGLNIGGFDGLNWPNDYGQSYNFLGWFSTEAMTNNGSTATYQAGAGFQIFTQPQWTRPGINATRQRFLFTNWSTSTTGPSVNNINIGSGVDATAPTMTMVDGTTYTGYGRANFNIINSTVVINGVTAQDSAPDNATLLNTNIIALSGSRRSGVSGRRNALQTNDTVSSISFNATTATGATATGPGVGFISVAMLENATNTARGTIMTLATVSTGTTAQTARLLLNATGNVYQSDNHSFRDKSGTFTAMSVTTSTVNITQGITFNLGTSARTVPTSTGITGVTPVVVGEFDVTVFNTAKFVVTIKDGTDVHTAEVLMTTNGTTISSTVYATVTVGTGVLGTFSTAFPGTTAQLIFTPTGATSMTVKASMTTI